MSIAGERLVLGSLPTAAPRMCHSPSHNTDLREERTMAAVELDLETQLSPDEVRAALLDFGPSRPDI